jgi:hypothetical protein
MERLDRRGVTDAKRSHLLQGFETCETGLARLEMRIVRPRIKCGA